MSKPIADLKASYNRLLAQKKGISCRCNSQLISANVQRNSLQQQVNVLNSLLSSANAQRSSLQQQVTDLSSQLTSVTKQRDALQTGPQNERWQSFNGHLYYLSTTTADWQTSRDDCLSKGADLLIINDAAENNYAGGFNRKVWIGLYKAGDTWTWVNGIRLDFDPCVNYWAKGEPNNVGNQEDRAELLFFDKIDSFDNVDRGHLGNCLEFFGRSEKVNSWNDAPGSKSNYWICEKEVV
ncbi:C-type lectin domain family 4 member K-like [Oryzias latipes]